MSVVRVSQAAVLVGAALVGVVIGSVGTLLLHDADSPIAGPGTSSSRTGSPPAASDGASLVVTAESEADVRIMVDGEPAFDGHLQSNETVRREGSARVEVWTNNAQGVSVIVNGHDLGLLAKAIGQPDWNRVAWTWSAGWTP